MKERKEKVREEGGGMEGGGVCLRERVSKNKIFYGPALGRGCFLTILVF